MKFNNIKSDKSLHIGAFLLGVLISGCASNPEHYSALAPNTDPAPEINRLNIALQDARKEQTDILAPSYYQQTKEETEKASELLKKNKDNASILKVIARAKAYEVSMNESAAIGRSSMDTVVTARAEALAANAPKTVKEELEKADLKFINYTQNIEDGKLNINVDDRKELANTYKDIELKAITRKYIGEAEDNIKKAQADGAEKLTPNVLKEAEKSFNDTKGAITANRYNVDLPTVEATNASAARLLKVTHEAKATKKKSSEEIAVEANNRENDLITLQEKVLEENQQRKASESEVTSLKKQTAIESKITELRSNFDPKEADVLRDGNRVVIRLHSVAFKTSDASLRAHQVDILSKVNKAVTEFEPKKVIVEGHTDSVGSSIVNKNLSEERAKLVTKYLVANGAVTAEKAESIGYGYKKPLATNKTAKGRAENRRVDIIIQL